MDLEVFSDPLSALAGDSGLPWDQLQKLTTYDEELIKPALLLADRVTLRTWRLDMQIGERVQLASSRLAVPLVRNIRELVYGGHKGAADRLGISDALIRDLRLVLDVYAAEPAELPDRRFFESDAVEQFVAAWQDHYARQFAALRSAELSRFVDDEVVTERGWDDRDLLGMGFAGARHVYNEQSFAYGWSHLVDDLAYRSAAVVLDPVIEGKLAALGQPHTPVPQSETLQVLQHASGLMRMVDGLSSASLDEIRDIRTDLSPHLAPFRSFILRQARDVTVDPDAPLIERQRQLVVKWEADVAPAIADLKYKIEQDRFTNKLVSVAGSSPEAAIGVGLGLVAGVATGVGVLALAGLGVGALPTIIKAAAASRQGKQDHQRNGAYLVVEVEKRFKARLKDGG